MATTYLSRTLASGSNPTVCTFSFWSKITNPDADDYFFTAGDGTDNFWIRTDSNKIYLRNEVGTETGMAYKTNALYRDPAAWYHIVAAFDTGESASDRQKLWINGEQITSWATSLDMSDTYFMTGGSGDVQYIGKRMDSAAYTNGVMAHFHYIDGTAYTASAFGETDATSGIWVAKSSPSVTYGTNGFFLKFASGALGTDSSGNGNNFTVSGTMTTTKDTPDNNFATWNPLIYGASSLTMANGNNAITAVADTSYYSIYGTIPVSTGKWYWEMKAVNVDSASNRMSWGIGDVENLQNASSGEVGDKSNSWTWDSAGGYKTGGSGGQESSDYLSYTTGDIIAFALDCDNAKLYLAKNNTWQKSGVPTSGATGTGAISITADLTYAPGGNMRYAANQAAINFGNGYFGTTAVTSAEADGNGEGQFEYAPPTGYFALCTNNLGSES